MIEDNPGRSVGATLEMERWHKACAASLNSTLRSLYSGMIFG
jgi:hypothetical protein